FVERVLVVFGGPAQFQHCVVGQGGGIVVTLQEQVFAAAELGFGSERAVGILGNQGVQCRQGFFGLAVEIVRLGQQVVFFRQIAALGSRGDQRQIQRNRLAVL